MKKFKNEFIGLCSGFFWAVNGTVLSLLMGSELLKSYNVGVIFLLPLVFAGFNDLFAGLFVLGYNGIFGKLNRILPALKTKTGKWVCLYYWLYCRDIYSFIFKAYRKLSLFLSWDFIFFTCKF